MKLTEKQINSLANKIVEIKQAKRQSEINKLHEKTRVKMTAKDKEVVNKLIDSFIHIGEKFGAEKTTSMILYGVASSGTSVSTFKKKVIASIERMASNVKYNEEITKLNTTAVPHNFKQSIIDDLVIACLESKTAAEIISTIKKTYGVDISTT